MTVSGARWQRLEGGKPEQRALVLRGSGVTTMVTGGASFAELRQLARRAAAAADARPRPAAAMLAR